MRLKQVAKLKLCFIEFHIGNLIFQEVFNSEYQKLVSEKFQNKIQPIFTGVSKFE